MSLNAIHRSIMIFSDKQIKAENKLNDLVKELNLDVVKRTRDTIVTPNGIIQARFFSEACRGFRYQEVYIDYSLMDVETINTILTKLVPPHYYDFEKYDENYSRKDHIHYF